MKVLKWIWEQIKYHSLPIGYALGMGYAFTFLNLYFGIGIFIFLIFLWILVATNVKREEEMNDKIP